MLLWWSCQSQLPIAAGSWIIRIVSLEECSSLMQNLMQISCSTLSHFECDGPQYTCSLNSVYHPHWLVVQWSHHCSCTCILVHSPWLPGSINVVQTILIILTMVSLFLERPCVWWPHFNVFLFRRFLVVYYFGPQKTDLTCLFQFSWLLFRQKYFFVSTRLRNIPRDGYWNFMLSSFTYSCLLCWILHFSSVSEHAHAFWKAHLSPYFIE